MALENTVLLGNDIFGAHGIGTHVVGPLPVFGTWNRPFSLTGQFMLKKRAFSIENEHFLEFFDFF